jgi:putative effector of murein hydrolase
MLKRPLTLHPSTHPPPADLSRALIPRSVTVALALPISQSLEAPLAITAAAVLLQGILVRAWRGR